MSEKERQRDRLAGLGVAMLDCPLSGNPDFARRRQAAALLSGEAEAISRVRPVIAGFTDNVAVLGAFGNGTRMRIYCQHAGGGALHGGWRKPSMQASGRG